MTRLTFIFARVCHIASFTATMMPPVDYYCEMLKWILLDAVCTFSLSLGLRRYRSTCERWLAIIWNKTFITTDK